MRVALLTHAHAAKAVQVAHALRRAGIDPALMIFEVPKESPFRRYASAGWRMARALARRAGSGRTPVAAEYARHHEIPIIQAVDLGDPQVLARLSTERIDVFIHAGAGILRTPLLAVPRLGTLNAHMGILPRYRGMNVAEWAAFNGDPVGCSVHLIDAGIDTGPILATREVSLDGVKSIDVLRARVNDAQLELLAAVVADVVEAGRLPRARTQRRDEGRQYYRMHPEIRELLERRLRSSETSSVMNGNSSRSASVLA
jgi:methionyl-tRNA formyltransferase